jgi:ATP-binding cassette subfamily C protein LapB
MTNPTAPADEAAAMTKDQTSVEDTLLQSVSWMCDHYDMSRSPAALVAGLPWNGALSPSLALKALSNVGLTGGVVKRGLPQLPAQVMPIILLREKQGGCILLERREVRDEENKRQLRYTVILPEVSAEPADLSHEELAAMYSGHAILVKPRAHVDNRAGEVLPEATGHWLFSTLWRYRRYYRSAAIAAVLANVLALASIFFTMNVYDRVVPNQAFVTLWSLGIGVIIAMVFEAVIRFVRAHLLDVAAKKADLVLGAMLFRQALSVKMEHKPASSGAFANQLREFESVRDFATSATLAAISDLPFVLMFVGVIFAIGGPLGWIPLLILPLIVIISVSIQWPLARVMKENLRESSLKQGVLIESIEGMETLKSTGGSANMQRRWQHFSALQSATSMKSRRLSSIATGTVTLLQQLQTVVLVITGVYLITDGTLSMGALIGTVMLAGRATAPLGQVIGLAVRFQQAKAALGSLNKLMEMPQDRDPAQDYLPMPNLSGQMTLKKIGFAYPAPPMQPNPPVLTDINLSIAPGERVAILGRIGSGKSTLLRVMSRLYSPTEGQIFTDGLDVNQIDPADWRKAVGFVNQEARLFHGTLRENVMLGCPEATVDEFLRVLRLTGLDQFAASHPRGVNLPIGENGDGVSGGQRQLISLARTLLARPRLLLMDEPTSAMDAQTEAQFLEHLHRATQGQTLVVVTHRPSLLNLVDRVIVMDNGRVFADGPKANVLTALGANANGEARAEASAPANPGSQGTAVAPSPSAAAVAAAAARAASNSPMPAPTIQSAPARVRQAKPQQQEAK